MGSPLPLIAISSAYLMFVLKIGPSLMENRKPFNITNITRLYNVLQVILCFWFVIKGQQYGYSLSYTLKCVVGKVLGNENDAFVIGWYFMLLRLSEYIETIFFVLRKKQNQISFLHVYHHLSVVGIYWMFLKYSSGEEDFIYFSLIKLTFIFRSNGDRHRSYQLLCAHHHVQLLLPQLIQELDDIHEVCETDFNRDSNRPACNYSRSHCCRCHARVQWKQTLLLSVY